MVAISNDVVCVHPVPLHCEISVGCGARLISILQTKTTEKELARSAWSIRWSFRFHFNGKLKKIKKVCAGMVQKYWGTRFHNFTTWHYSDKIYNKQQGPKSEKENLKTDHLLFISVKLKYWCLGNFPYTIILLISHDIRWFLIPVLVKYYTTRIKFKETLNDRQKKNRDSPYYGQRCFAFYSLSSTAKHCQNWIKQCPDHLLLKLDAHTEISGVVKAHMSVLQQWNIPANENKQKNTGYYLRDSHKLDLTAIPSLY